MENFFKTTGTESYNQKPVIDIKNLRNLLNKYPNAAKLFAQKILENWPEKKINYEIKDNITTVILYYPQILNSFINKILQNQTKENLDLFNHLIEKTIRFNYNLVKYQSLYAPPSPYKQEDFVEVNNSAIILKELAKIIDQFDISFITSLPLKTIDNIYYILNPEKRKLVKDFVLNNKLADIFPLLNEINIDLYPELKEYFKQYVINNFQNILTSENFDTIWALRAIFEKNPDLVFLLKDKIEKNIQSIDTYLLQVILLNLKNSPEIIAELIVKKDFSKEWQDLIKVLDNLKPKYYLGENLVKDIINRIKQIALKNPTEIPVGILEQIYHKLFNDSEKNQLKQEYLKKYKVKKTFAGILEREKIPSFLKKELETKSAEQKIGTETETQSKQHLLIMQSKLKEMKLALSDPKIREFFLRIYAQEKIEHANGNYVFYHGRMWLWNFRSDIFKQLWNIVKNDNVGENYQFLRFGTKVPGPRRRDEMDILFMNSAIFGNLTVPGSNTALYWYTNNDQSGNKKDKDLTLKGFFKSFNLESLYDKYQKEFNELSRIHERASKRGEILLISIPPDKLDNVISTHAGGGLRTVIINGQKYTNTREILDAIKKNPKDIKDIDILAWGLILGTWKIIGSKGLFQYYLSPYASDPHNGPTVYSFYMADEKIMDEYRRKRDQLFAKIKNDVQEINKAKQSIGQQVLTFIKSKI